MLLDAYIIVLSDTQALTSIALLVTANFFVGCTISAYHYDLVCSLVLMSSASYIVALAVMHKYFDFEKHQYWQYTRSVMRIPMVATAFILSFILFLHRPTVFPSLKPYSDVINQNRTSSTVLVLPAACFINHPGQPNASNQQNFTASPSWTQNCAIQAANQSSLHGNSSSSGTSNISTLVNMPVFSNVNSNDDLSSGGDLTALIFLLFACVIAGSRIFILSQMKKEDNCPHKGICRHRVAYFPHLGCVVTTYAIAFYGLDRFLELQGWMIKSRWFEKNDAG